MFSHTVSPSPRDVRLKCNINIEEWGAPQMVCYLNARKAVWKHALDAWFCRAGLGRGAVMSSCPPCRMQGARGASSEQPPPPQYSILYTIHYS
eukprot:scaffold5761_cov39-Tisochrysis_lutea.AAC.1